MYGGDHVPGEVGDLLRSETCFDREQSNHSITQRISRALEHGEEQGDLALGESLGLLR